MLRELDLSGLTQTNATYISLLVQGGQIPRWVSNFFGKDYLWLEDPQSRRWYLEQLHYEMSNNA